MWTDPLFKAIVHNMPLAGAMAFTLLQLDYSFNQYCYYATCGMSKCSCSHLSNLSGMLHGHVQLTRQAITTGSYSNSLIAALVTSIYLPAVCTHADAH